MTFFKKLAFLFLAIISFNACEKDDICVEGDTPLLILTFYDAVDTSLLKSVTNLRVVGLGQETTVNTFTDRSTLDSIAIPLQINEPNTGFLIILNSEDDDNDLETGNIDTLMFNYSTEEVWISRACGFVANFNELTNTLTSDSDNWIQNVEINNPSVKKLDSAHVKIFH